MLRLKNEIRTLFPAPPAKIASTSGNFNLVLPRFAFCGSHVKT